MKKIVLLALICLPISIGAQTPTPLPVSGPLIAPQAPAFSHWIVTCSYAGGKSEAELDSEYQANLKQTAATDPVLARLVASGSLAVARKPRLQQRMVIKTGDIREEVRVYASGQKEEKWQIGNSATVHDPFTQKLSVERSDLVTKSDFPEFAWINKGNFTGEKDVDGRKCSVFEGKVQPQLIDQPEIAGPGHEANTGEDLVPATAVIDSETRLPLLLKFGDQTRKYEFVAPPTALLTVPPEVQAFLQQYEARMKARRS